MGQRLPTGTHHLHEGSALRRCYPPPRLGYSDTRRELDLPQRQWSVTLNYPFDTYN